MSEPFIGEIRMVGFNFAPRGWAFCDGRLLAISQFSALFSLLGTVYGGNGTTTFALPDLRGRAPVGMGTGPGLTPITQGEQAGTENVTLLSTQMPPHNHAVALQVAGTASNPVNAPTTTNNRLGASGGGPGNATIWSDALTDPVAMPPIDTTIAGGGQAVPIRNPFMGTNFVIALEGIFPSRN